MKRKTGSRKIKGPQTLAKVHRPNPESFPIVGIGASAGGLEAVSALLKHLPGNTGLALVIVQHLDPTHESALTALLARATTMPVQEARNDALLEPNQVYVIPPNKLMVVSERRLSLTPRRDSPEAPAPIDHFLVSLAQEEGSRAIGVILSGSGGSDGTQGLLAIKSAGGITFAQDQKSAKYPSMPGAAVAAGCVDFVLPPNKIAQELARLAGHPYVATAPEEAEEVQEKVPAEEKDFESILVILRQRMSVDFTQYKRATLHRRIQRRMVLQKCESLRQYADYLRSHSDEVKELFSDILIHVTGFFRDPTVFQTLKRRIFPRICRERTPDDAIRIWVPGCSTGEEAYSLAMAITEFLQDKRVHCPVQIFGTDINDRALDKARAGVYSDTIRNDVSNERLRRFFMKTESGFRVNKTIREMCIFARQNVVSDPPFSNLDLVSCRNVLIYLGAPLQRKVMPLFHYALKSAGFLLLGASETIGGFADLFTLVDRKAKVYTKKPTRTRPAVTFGHPAPIEHATEADHVPAPLEIGPSLNDVQRQADRIVLTHHAPPGVVINRHMEVLQFRGRTGPFLEHAQGEASLSLLKMAREGIVVTLRSAVTRAIRQNARIHEENIRFPVNGGVQTVTIDVMPFQIPPSRERFFLVLFEAVAPLPEPTDKKGKARSKAGRTHAPEPAEMARLQEELAATRESLQAIIEEQEATNEELRSANEEIMSSNEELQSTNEELETAKEELQSTNEELTTLNDELESRNVELEHVNNDLQNLLASVNIPVVMVGGDMRIRRFTTVAEKMLNLIPGDIGRPLTDINFPISLPRLEKVVAEVMDSLQTREMEAQDRNGLWWSVRIRPYKTTDSKIDGVIIALVDIDVLKTSMEHIRRGSEMAMAVVDTVRRPLVILNQDLVVQQANEMFYKTLGLRHEDTINRRIYDLCNGQWDTPAVRAMLEHVPPDGSSMQEGEIELDLGRGGRKKFGVTARRLIVAAGSPHLILIVIEDSGESDERKNSGSPPSAGI